MPLFTESPGDRSFERMMTSIPGFRAKRHGTVEYPVAVWQGAGIPRTE